jgi:hypothetical protein
MQEKKRKREDVMTFPLLQAVLPHGGVTEPSLTKKQKTQNKHNKFIALWARPDTKETFIQIMNTFAHNSKNKVSTAELANKIIDDGNHIFTTLDSDRSIVVDFLKFGKASDSIPWLKKDVADGVEVIHNKRTFSLVVTLQPCNSGKQVYDDAEAVFFPCGLMSYETKSGVRYWKSLTGPTTPKTSSKSQRNTKTKMVGITILEI